MLTALLILSGCSKPSSAPERPTGDLEKGQVSAPEAVVVPSTEKITEKKSPAAPVKKEESNWLAKLEKALNRVEFRQRNESIWKPAETGMIFAKFDALQTQSQSTAKVLYQSGSNLDIKDNTFIIFDHDPGTKKKSEDRVIIKNGELVGTTKTELWVFTNSGLVQIKPESKAKPAKAKVTLAKNDKLNVKVDAGSADVVIKDKEQKFEKIHVAEKSDIEIAPAAKLLGAETTVTPEKIAEITSASDKVTKVTRAELKVTEPIDGAISAEPEITAKGELSAAGGKLLINGQLVELKDDFSFAKKIVLQPGSNLIVFQLVRSDASVQFMRKTIRLQAGK
jgi:hypothetical protein